MKLASQNQNKAKKKALIRQEFISVSLFYCYLLEEYLAHSKCSICFKDFIYLFLERGEGKEKGRERNINVWLPPACPLVGTWPATRACALTGNQTGNPLVCRRALNPLSHTNQGQEMDFIHCSEELPQIQSGYILLS